MSATDVLKNFRSSGYEKKPDEEPKKETAVRTIQLTDDEMKELQGYQEGPGQEQTCEVTGKLEADGHFHVMSVHAPGGQSGDMDAMAKDVAGSSKGGLPMISA